MYRCADCGKSFDHEYRLANHVASAHTRLFTMDNYLITDGMAVWDYNLDLVTVDLSSAKPEYGGDVWFSCKTPNGSRGPLMNGERVRTRHPSTNKRAEEALVEVRVIEQAIIDQNEADAAAYEAGFGDDLPSLSTPKLVREFTESKVSAARGERSTHSEHERHCRVVTELRSRGVLD